MSSDPVARLRVVAAGLRAGLYAEQWLDQPYERVWAVVTDLAGELPGLVPFLREFRVCSGDARRKDAVAMGPLGVCSKFEVRLAPGWCLMQSRFVAGGMAAVAEEGGTRFAMLGALRPTFLLPFQTVYARTLGVGRARAFVRLVEARAAARG
jgi:hypothetical protein